MNFTRYLPVRSVLLLILILSTTSVSSAQVPSEVDKIKGLISLIKSATKDCGKLRDWTTIPNSQNEYYIYTFSEAADLLSEMLKEGRIKKGNLGGGAKTCNYRGIDSDIIVIDSGVLSDMCSTDPTTAAKAKMQLVGSLMNEMIHIIQKISSTKDCEHERDSDRGSLKLMCKILDAMTQPNGMPHTTLAGIGNDAQKIPALVDCLKLVGVTPTTPNLATVLAAVRDKVKQEKERFRRRIDCFFNPIIANPQDNWKDYYRNGGHRARAPRKVKKIARTSTELENRDSTVQRTYVNPPGEQTTQSAGFSNLADESVLVTSTIDGSGNYVLHWWHDVDDDFLPENPAAANLVIPGPFGDPGLEGVGLYVTDRPMFGAMSLFVHDLALGAMWWVQLDGLGLPTGGLQQMIVDPAISSGAHEFFEEVWEYQPGVARFVFSSTVPVGIHSATPVVWFDYDPLFNVATPNFGLGLTEAMVLAPFHDLGVIDLDGSSLFHLTGNPGDFLTIDSVGQGTFIPVGQGLAGNDGLTPLILAQPTLKENDYYLISNGVDSTIRFHPRHGFGADSAQNDENGDGTLDHLELTTSPGRLHLAAGIPSAPPEIRQHIYEMVLEDPDPNHILSWDGTGRQVTTDTGLLDFILLPGSVPPLYVQSIHDFNGDTNADEAVIIRRQDQFTPQFVIELIFNVGSAPFPVQQIPLGTYIPDHFTVGDTNGDGIPDLCIVGIEGQGDLNLVGTPTGNLIPFTPIYPGTFEDLLQTTTVNGQGCPIAQVKDANLGDTIDFTFLSPFGHFNGALNTIVLGQLYPTGGFLNPTFPGIAVDIFATPGPFLVFNSVVNTPLGPIPTPLGAGGIGLQLPIPPVPSLAGQDLMLQSMVLDAPLAANNIFSSANGSVIRIH